MGPKVERAEFARLYTGEGEDSTGTVYGTDLDGHIVLMSYGDLIWAGQAKLDTGDAHETTVYCVNPNGREVVPPRRPVDVSLTVVNPNDFESTTITVKDVEIE
jgi:hypothetical protein